MNRRNVIGSSKGFVERVCESYDSVEVINVRTKLKKRPIDQNVVFLDQKIFSQLPKVHESVQEWGNW